MKTLRHLLIIALPFLIMACSGDGKEKSGSKGKRDGIAGKWESTFDAYGNKWDAPLIMTFNPDGTGYQWFSDEDFADRWNYSYEIEGDHLTIDLGERVKDLKYELEGNRLTIYGWDDNDMSKLVFHTTE